MVMLDHRLRGLYPISIYTQVSLSNGDDSLFKATQMPGWVKLTRPSMMAWNVIPR